jgi:hypothetical protein
LIFGHHRRGAPITFHDYENVQPKELALLRGGHFKVKLFLGASQAKIPVALAAALHALGTNAEYVLLESRGPNALDFLPLAMSSLSWRLLI